MPVESRLEPLGKGWLDDGICVGIDILSKTVLEIGDWSCTCDDGICVELDVLSKPILQIGDWSGIGI